MGRIEGKVAVVTGAASGIGAATATLLANEGAKVAVFDMDAKGSALADTLSSNQMIARYWKVDVADEASVTTALASVVDAFGKIDILVNNAGVSGAPKPTDEMTTDEWDHVMNVNLKGVFFCTKYVIPPMRANGSGSIINLSSIYGMVGTGIQSAYHASKGAVRMMTKNDALSYARDRIRVNSVHPGLIWTPLLEAICAKSPGGLEASKKQLSDLHPLGHLGEPEDIASAILYLASDEAKFVTGSELVVDGGYTAR